MPREIRIRLAYVTDPGDGEGWRYYVSGRETDCGALGDPESLPEDASLEQIQAAWLRSRQVLGDPCLSCGAAAPERDQLIAQMVGEGRPLREIGEAVGLSERQVTRIAQRAGIRRGRGRPAKPVETRGEAIAAGRYSIEGAADGAAAAGRGEEITAEQAAAPCGDAGERAEARVRELEAAAALDENDRLRRSLAEDTDEIGRLMSRARVLEAEREEAMRRATDSAEVVSNAHAESRHLRGYAAGWLYIVEDALERDGDGRERALQLLRDQMRRALAGQQRLIAEARQAGAAEAAAPPGPGLREAAQRAEALERLGAV